jgi:23S rRNA (pseudouridine1915-N3)-methyltransferase
MKISIVQVGRVRQAFVKDGEQEYLKRLRSTPYALTITELGLESSEALRAAEVQEREGTELLKRLDSFEYVVVLDERGKQLSSVDFSQLLATRANTGTRSIAFVIGGAYGFSENVRQRADYVLSLSKMTLPHQVTRLVLVEQLYRAYTLGKGISYHK